MKKSFVVSAVVLVMVVGLLASCGISSKLDGKWTGTLTTTTVLTFKGSTFDVSYKSGSETKTASGTYKVTNSATASGITTMTLELDVTKSDKTESSSAMDFNYVPTGKMALAGTLSNGDKNLLLAATVIGGSSVFVNSFSK